MLISDDPYVAVDASTLDEVHSAIKKLNFEMLKLLRNHPMQPSQTLCPGLVH